MSPDDASDLRTPGSDGWHDALDAHCERFLGRSSSALGEIVPTSRFTVTLYPHPPSSDRPWLTLRTAGGIRPPDGGAGGA